MADNVVARQASGWIVVCTTPDVCKTPMGPSTPPVPYRVTAQLADAAQVVPSVKANGRPLVVLTRSFIPKTIGDEAGTAKGVESGTVAGICEPLEHSSSVRVGGFCALRHDDKFHMNSKNTTGKIVGQSSSTNKSASESNPKVVPETPEEKSGWELLAESYRLQTEYRRNLLDDISAFFARSRAWGQTPEGIGIMAAHTANVESRAQAENLRRYVEENAGAEGLAAFDRTYVKGYSVLAEVLPMYLAAASVVSTGGKLGGAPDEIYPPGKVPSAAATGADDVVLASGARLSRTPSEPVSTGRDGFIVKKASLPGQNGGNKQQFSQNGSQGGEPVENKNPYGTYRPDRSLPRDKNGNPLPDVDAPHTQLGTKSGRKGNYTQAREWGYDDNRNVVPKRDIDFTDHGRPNEHPNPHQHDYVPNPSGGTPQHGPARKMEVP